MDSRSSWHRALHAFSAPCAGSKGLKKEKKEKKRKDKEKRKRLHYVPASLAD